MHCTASPARIKRDQRRDRRARVRTVLQPKLPAALRDVWASACAIWQTLCDVFDTPASLAEREFITRSEHKLLNDWVYHLELLIHRLVLVGALALNFVLRPLQPHAPRPRKSRRVLLWPARPEAWPARFRMMRGGGRNADDSYRPPQPARPAPAVVSSFPLARRIEAMRRVLANPDARIRSFAIKLARLAERNARANTPRCFRLRKWLDPKRITAGRRMIAAPMRIVHPLACDRIDDWNEAAEPG